MQPRIETFSEKHFVGKKMTMSFADNKTGALWKDFMPRRQDIKHGVGTELYSIEDYPADFFEKFDPTVHFQKWAAIEVSDLTTVPDGLETLTVPSGLYAVFLHKGPASSGPQTYQYIYGTWIPQSEYALDDRPHFAVMGEKYKNDDPDSEEELWIPIKAKAI